MRALPFLLAGLVSGLPGGASAQTDLGENWRGGLPWHVSAPGGAAWTLVCRFQPVTYYINWADQHHWANYLERRGRGAGAGRLPAADGRCTVTKTGGEGRVAIALVKNGVATVAVTSEPARPARIVVF